MQVVWMQSETARSLGMRSARLLDRANHGSFLCLADGGMISGNVCRCITRLEDRGFGERGAIDRDEGTSLSGAVVVNGTRG